MNNLSSKSETSTKLYESFTSSINQVARKVIRRRTIKYSHKGTLTQQIPKELRREKARKKYEAAVKTRVNAEITKSREQYFILQDRVRSAVMGKQSEYVEKKLNEIITTGSTNSRAFWKFRKKLLKSDTDNLQIIKDKNGKKLYDAESIKESSRLL